MREYILISVFVFQVFFGFSQNDKKISIQDCLLNSDIVVEAEITGIQSFWNLQHKNIYTAFELKIITPLAGHADNNPKLLLKGGKVDDILQIVSTSPKLEIGDKAIFMLQKLAAQNKISSNSNDLYFLFNSEFSFISLGNETQKIESVNEDEVLTEIEKISGKKIKNKISAPVLKSAKSSQNISGFLPKTVTAGTGSTLTINGEGFGNSQGGSLVWFTNADNPYQIFSNSDFKILSWSDTQIQMIVPPEAATGKIIVEVDGTKTESTEKLTVKYNVIQQNYKPVYLTNKNSKGGYTFHLHGNVNSYSGAKEIIENSIKNWICATSVPWEIGNTLNIEPGSDDICSIQFGDLSGTGGETLGQASYFLESAGSSDPNEYVLSEVDIVFSNAENWCFDNSNLSQQQIDFASVVLHELGHAHLIGHVNEINDLMHFSLANGKTRDIGQNNVLCGEYIVNKSLAFKSNYFQTIKPISSTPPVFSVKKDTLYSTKEYNTYQWLLNGSKINNANQRKYVISASGEYALEVTDANNCWLISESVNVVKSDPGSNDTVFTFICPSNLTIDCADNFPQPFTNLANFVSAGGIATSTPSPVDESTFAWESDVSDNKSCPEKITRTYSIQNENGDILKCEQIIYVSDTEYPKLVMGNKIVSCPDDKPVIYANKLQFEAELGNFASDNCGLDWTTFKFNSQVTDGNYCSEISVRSYEIKDMCGNRLEASEYIVVEDMIPPTIKCPADASFDDGIDNLKDLTGLAFSETEKQIPSSDYSKLDILVSDNCLLEKATYKDIQNSFCPVEISRTFFAFDVCGNFSTCTQKIEFTRGITLSETHENDGADNLNTGKINLEVSGGAPPYQFQWSNGETTEDIENLPSGSYKVEVEDSNGCTDSLAVNIESDTASVNIVCPSSLTISCKKDIDQSVYSEYSEFIAAGGSAFGDCGIDTGTFAWAGDEVTDGSDCRNIDRTYTVNDSCGTTAFCIQSISVIDQESPVLNCPSEVAVVGEIQPEHYENYSAFVAAGGSAEDNCEINESSFEWINDSSDGKINPETIIRTYQIADFCGNLSNCEQIIKVFDNSGIFINCPPDMTILCSEDKPDAPLNYADFIADDGGAGSLPDFPLIESSFQVETVENNDFENCKEYITRKYLIMNENGDTAICEQQIVIINPSVSAISCPPDISINGNENIPAGYNSLNEFVSAGGIFSNMCGTDYDLLYSLSEYKDSIQSPNLVERTYFLTDLCGNQNLCIQKINIKNTTQSFDNKWNSNFKVKIFPNPTNGKFVFEAEGIKNKDVTISIYNGIGERITQVKLVSINGELKKEMDLSVVSKGVYFIKIQDGINSNTQSIIVE